MNTRRRFLNLLLLAVRLPKPEPAAITPASVRAYTPRPALIINSLSSSHEGIIVKARINTHGANPDLQGATYIYSYSA